MKLHSVLLLFVIGLTAYDFTFSVPVEFADFENLKNSIVDSSKAAEIIDNKQRNIEDDSSDAEKVEYSEEEASSKKEEASESLGVPAFVGRGSFGGDVGGALYGQFYRVVPILAGGRGFLFGKGDIPNADEQDSASSRQGVAYPFVGYGPWASYPWWAGWRGGYGRHGWRSHGWRSHGWRSHGYGGYGGHYGGYGYYGLGGRHGYGFGLHCRDMVPDGNANEGSKGKGKSKRFCVPIGYHGGYGWPFWRGYPGAGLGMFGWGWPWHKSKVPKGKKSASVKAKKARKPNGKKFKSPKRDWIPRPDHNPEKKQTIHVGYGFASGDNYRLGYGMGGMGGVNSFNGGAQPVVAQVDDGHGQSGYKKSAIPAPLPDNIKEVTGTKREFNTNQNGVGVGYDPSANSIPVTHPGFTTMSWPGHAIATTDIKNTIPKGPLKVKRQAFDSQDGYGGMSPMQEQTPDQQFPQEQVPEMMGPSRFSNQSPSPMSQSPTGEGYPVYERASIPRAPRPNLAPNPFNSDDSWLY